MAPPQPRTERLADLIPRNPLTLQAQAEHLADVLQAHLVELSAREESCGHVPAPASCAACIADRLAIRLVYRHGVHLP